MLRDAERSRNKGFVNVTSDGIFQGYAAVFDEPASDGLSVRRGAFLESLKNNPKVKMLWQHDVEEIVGSWLEIREDEVGLFVRGQLNLDTERGAEAKSLMEGQTLDGLSIGFSIIESDGDTVTKLDLWEISLVTFPAQSLAQVDRMAYFRDLLAIDGKPVRTVDGYLAVTALAARTGVQIYKGIEVGRPEMDTVRVYRPEKEVFSKRTMHSMAHRPMTNDHPPVPVTSDNWKKYSVGHTGDEIIREGQFVRVPLVLMDQSVIKDYEDGKHALSLGYTTDLKWGSGKTDDGEEYDAVQTNIRANHLAVVTAARGGPALKIGDDENGDSDMNVKKITVDGVELEMGDIAASVVNRTIQSLSTQITNLQSALKKEQDEKEAAGKGKDSAIADHKKVIDAKDAELATVKQQLKDAEVTPARLDQLVTERTTVIQKAGSILGDKLVSDGKTIAEIQKQVVSDKLGDTAKDWNDVKIAASFDTLTADVKVDPLAQALSNTSRVTDGRDQAYQDRNKRLQDSYKKVAA